jgi:hypothetical protein
MLLFSSIDKDTGLYSDVQKNTSQSPTSSQGVHNGVSASRAERGVGDTVTIPKQNTRPKPPLKRERGGTCAFLSGAGQETAAPPIGNEQVWALFSAWTRKGKGSACVRGPTGCGKTSGVVHFIGPQREVIHVDASLTDDEIIEQIASTDRNSICRETVCVVEDIDAMSDAVLRVFKRVVVDGRRKLICTLTDAHSALLREMLKACTTFQLRGISVSDMLKWCRSHGKGINAATRLRAEQCQGDMRKFQVATLWETNAAISCIPPHPYEGLRSAFLGWTERGNIEYSESLLFHNYLDCASQLQCDMERVVHVAESFSNSDLLRANECRDHLFSRGLLLTDRKGCKCTFSFPARQARSKGSLWNSWKGGTSAGAENVSKQTVSEEP